MQEYDVCHVYISCSHSDSPFPHGHNRFVSKVGSGYRQHRGGKYVFSCEFGWSKQDYLRARINPIEVSSARIMNCLHVILLLERAKVLGRIRAGLVSSVWVFLLFVPLFGVVLNVPAVEANGTMYIHGDGSITPAGAPVSTVDNVTYTLTDNIVDAAPSDNATAIVIERNNTVLNGAGYTLQGTYASYSKGIELSGRSNVTVKNITIKQFYYGVCLSVSFGNIVSGNNITANNEFGVELSSSSSNTVSGNNVTYSNYAGIYLYNSSNNIVSGNNITSNYRGVYFLSSHGNTVSGNNVTYNDYAGVTFYYSSFNIVSGNSITNSYRGVDLWQSSSNIVSGNNIVNNTGVSNSGYGIYIASSSGNSFYHNNFVNNTKQAYDYGLDDPHIPPSTNVWDNEYPSGGNYWNDYVGVDANCDGICDIPYNIDVYSEDNYPSMGMSYDFEVVRWGNEKYHVQVVSNSTVSELYLAVWLSSPNQYLQPGQEFLQLFVEGENHTRGFCRITIPRALLNGTYTVLVDWTEVPAHELTASNTTYAYLYFAYNHTKHEIIIIPEFPLFLIQQLFMITTLLAVIVYKRKHTSKVKGI